MMNVWRYQKQISNRLMTWSIASILVGFLMRFGGKFWKNLGNQFIAWGVIDAAIAVGGDIATKNRIDQLTNPGKAEIQEKEASSLSRLLWLNAALDILYMLGGVFWARRDKGDGVASGNGLGVIIQGTFLLFFDTIHARNMPQSQDE